MSRRFVAYGLVVLLMLPIPLVALYLMLKSEPAGYTRATDFTTEQLQNQAADFYTASAQIVNTLQDKSSQTPLDVTFTDAAINSQLRLLPPDKLRNLPTWLANPQVVFTPESVVVMASVTYNGTQAIASFHVAPTVTPDGNLRLALLKSRAGQLPLPVSLSELLSGHLDGRIVTAEERLKRTPKKDQYAETSLVAMKVMQSLFSGQPAEVETTGYRLKLETIELYDHRIRVTGRRIDKPATPPSAPSILAPATP